MSILIPLHFFVATSLLTDTVAGNKLDSKEREKGPSASGGSNVRRMALIRPAIKLGLHWIGRTVCPELNGYT